MITYDLFQAGGWSGESRGVRGDLKKRGKGSLEKHGGGRDFPQISPLEATIN